MKTVLLVQDRPVVGTTVMKLLEEYGYRVQQVQAGPESLSKALQVKPDVVLVDIPSASPGFEVAQILARAVVAPCILVTSESRVEVRTLIEKAQSVVAVVFAPFEDDQLLNALGTSAFRSMSAVKA